MNYIKLSLGIIASVLYVFLYAAERTARFGFVLKTSFVFFFVATILVIAISLVARVKMTKKIILVIAGMILALTIIGEAFAVIQERQIEMAHSHDCVEGTYIARWPPFSNHGIYCGETGRWVGND